MSSAIAQKEARDAAEGAVLEQPPILTIETPRLLLETMTMSLLDDIMPIITNLDVMRWTSRPAIHSRADAAHWLSARCLGKDVFNFAIRLKPSSPDSPARRTGNLPLVGLVGSFHWPSCGYMIDTAHAGRGYATEALRAFIPAYFARVPRASAGGHDVLEGYADTENGRSHRVLEKCGFTRCEVRVGDFENPVMGVRDTVAFRLARPGRTLVELGFVAGSGEVEERLVPPAE